MENKEKLQKCKHCNKVKKNLRIFMSKPELEKELFYDDDLCECKFRVSRLTMPN